MKGFIEVVYNGKKTLVNIHHIVYVFDRGDGTTMLHLLPSKSDSHLMMGIKSDYATIVEAIEWALQ